MKKLILVLILTTISIKSYSQIINDIDRDIWYRDNFYAGPSTAQWANGCPVYVWAERGFKEISDKQMLDTIAKYGSTEASTYVLDISKLHKWKLRILIKNPQYVQDFIDAVHSTTYSNCIMMKDGMPEPTFYGFYYSFKNDEMNLIFPLDR